MTSERLKIPTRNSMLGQRENGNRVPEAYWTPSQIGAYYYQQFQQQSHRIEDYQEFVTNNYSASASDGRSTTYVANSAATPQQILSSQPAIVQLQKPNSNCRATLPKQVAANPRVTKQTPSYGTTSQGQVNNAQMCANYGSNARYYTNANQQALNSVVNQPQFGQYPKTFSNNSRTTRQRSVETLITQMSYPSGYLTPSPSPESISGHKETNFNYNCGYAKQPQAGVELRCNLEPAQSQRQTSNKPSNVTYQNYNTETTTQQSTANYPQLLNHLQTASGPSGYSTELQQVSTQPSFQRVSTQPSFQRVSTQTSVQGVSTQPSFQRVSTQPSFQRVSTQTSVQGVSTQSSVQRVSTQPSFQRVSTQPSVQRVSTQPSFQRVSTQPSFQQVPAESRMQQGSAANANKVYADRNAPQQFTSRAQQQVGYANSNCDRFVPMKTQPNQMQSILHYKNLKDLPTLASHSSSLPKKAPSRQLKKKSDHVPSSRSSVPVNTSSTSIPTSCVNGRGLDTSVTRPQSTVNHSPVATQAASLPMDKATNDYLLTVYENMLTSRNALHLTNELNCQKKNSASNLPTRLPQQRCDRLPEPSHSISGKVCVVRSSPPINEHSSSSPINKPLTTSTSYSTPLQAAPISTSSLQAAPKIKTEFPSTSQQESSVSTSIASLPNPAMTNTDSDNDDFDIKIVSVYSLSAKDDKPKVANVSDSHNCQSQSKPHGLPGDIRSSSTAQKTNEALEAIIGKLKVKSELAREEIPPSTSSTDNVGYAIPPSVSKENDLSTRGKDGLWTNPVFPNQIKLEQGTPMKDKVPHDHCSIEPISPPPSPKTVERKKSNSDKNIFDMLLDDMLLEGTSYPSDEPLIFPSEKDCSKELNVSGPAKEQQQVSSIFVKKERLEEVQAISEPRKVEALSSETLLTPTKFEVCEKVVEPFPTCNVNSSTEETMLACEHLKPSAPRKRARMSIQTASKEPRMDLLYEANLKRLREEGQSVEMAKPVMTALNRLPNRTLRQQSIRKYAGEKSSISNKRRSLKVKPSDMKPCFVVLTDLNLTLF